MEYYVFSNSENASMLEFWELPYLKFGSISDVLSYNAVFDCFRLCPDSLLIVMIQMCYVCLMKAQFITIEYFS